MIEARYSGSDVRRSFAWDMTPWHVLHMLRSGRPVRSARAKLRALRVSPRRRFFSCSTPEPVQDADRMGSNSSSMPSLSQTAMVDANSSGAAPRETQPG